MKVEQKFIVTIKDSPFELSKQEAESLYYELQKELGLMQKVNIPSIWPDYQRVLPYTVPVKDYEWLNTAPYKPNYTITCSNNQPLDTIP